MTFKLPKEIFQDFPDPGRKRYFTLLYDFPDCMNPETS